MKHASRLLLFCLLIALTACGPPQAHPVPEWKAAYLQLMKDTLTGGVLEPRGIMKGHTIELIDYDGDGIPELQETFIRNAPEYHIIWFIENGEARPITGDHEFLEKANDTITFEGLWRHDETGELVLTDFLSSWGHSRLYRYSPTADKGIWKLDSLVNWSTTGYPVAGQPEELGIYNDFDSSIHAYDGTETAIQNAQAQQIIEDFYSSHTRLQGEPLPLEALYPWSDESARTISDFFDAYDGIPSKAADAPPPPEPPIADWKCLYYDYLKSTYSEENREGRIRSSIQLIDLNDDGIPELLEECEREFFGHGLYLWYVDGEYLQSIATDREEETHHSGFSGLYRHKTTGQLLLHWEDPTLSGDNSRDFFFVPTQQPGKWQFHFGLSAFDFADETNSTAYFTDETGAERAISAEEYIDRHPLYSGERPYEEVRGQALQLAELWDVAEKEIVRILGEYDNVRNSAEQYRSTR